MIEVGKFYRYHYQDKAALGMECLARYGSGGVCVSTGKTYDNKPQIFSNYLLDADFGKHVFEVVPVVKEIDMNLALIELRLREIANIGYNMKYAVDRTSFGVMEEQFTRIQKMAEEALLSLTKKEK